MSNRGQRPRTAGNSFSISLEGCTPAKMAARAAAPKAQFTLMMMQTACTSFKKRFIAVYRKGISWFCLFLSSTLPLLVFSSFCPFVSSSLSLFISLSFTHSRDSCSKMNADLMSPFMSIHGEKGGGVPPKKPTILSVFFAIQH